MHPLGTEALELAAAREAAARDELEAALARVDRLVAAAPSAEALAMQHALRLRLCWMVGALEPLGQRVELLRRQGAAWRDDAARLVQHHARHLDADKALLLLDQTSPAGPRRLLDRVEILVASGRFADARRCAAEGFASDGFDAAEALELAAACLRAGDASLARRIAGAAVARAPTDVAALAFDGTMLLWSGDLGRASDRAAEALSLAPDAAAGLKLAGQVALLRGELVSAVDLFERALVGGQDHETLILLAEAHRARGARAEARSALARARAIEESYSFAREANHLLLLWSSPWLQAIDRVAPLDRLFWSNRLELRGALAALGLAPRSWREPRDLPAPRRRPAARLGEALARLSGNRSAILTQKTGDGAFACAQRGPAVRAACVRLRAGLASFGFAEVIASHDALLEEHGHSPLVYTHRGELLLWSGRYDDAARDFETALGLYAGTRWAWAGLGACHLLRGHPARALATFAMGRLHVTPALTTHVYAAEAWHRLGAERRAHAAFRTAKALHPCRPAASLGLALAAACLRRRDEVDASLRDLGRLAPGFTRALLRRTATTIDLLRGDLALAREVTALGLEAMRGNRASGLVTWFDASGRAHLEGVTPDRAGFDPQAPPAKDSPAPGGWW